MSIQPRQGLSRHPSHQTSPQNIPQPKGPPFPNSYNIQGPAGGFQQTRGIISHSPGNLPTNSPLFHPPPHDIGSGPGGISTPPPPQQQMLMPTNQWPQAQNQQPTQQIFYQQTQQPVNPGVRPPRQTAPNQQQYIQYVQPQVYRQSPTPNRYPPTSANTQHMPYQAHSQQLFGGSPAGAAYFQTPAQRPMQYQYQAQNMQQTYPPQQQMMPAMPMTVQTQVQTAPPPPQLQQRKRTIITIKDPNTNADVTEEIMSSAVTRRQGSTNTPPSGRSSVDPIANMQQPSQAVIDFQSQVAAVAQQNTSPPDQPSQPTDAIQKPNAFIPPTVPSPAVRGTSPHTGVVPPSQILPAAVPSQATQSVQFIPQKSLSQMQPPPAPASVPAVKTQPPPPVISPAPSTNAWNIKPATVPFQKSSPQVSAEVTMHVQKVAVTSEVKQDDYFLDGTTEVNNNTKLKLDSKVNVDNKDTLLKKLNTDDVTPAPKTELKEDVVDSKPDESFIKPEETTLVTDAVKEEPTPVVKQEQKSDVILPLQTSNKSEEQSKQIKEEKPSTSESDQPVKISEPQQGIIKEDTAIRLKDKEKTDSTTEIVKVETKSNEPKPDDVSKPETPLSKLDVNVIPATPPSKTVESNSSESKTPVPIANEVPDKSSDGVKLSNVKSNKVEANSKTSEAVSVNGTLSSPESKEKSSSTKPSSSDTNAKGDKVVQKAQETPTDTNSKPASSESTPKPPVQYDQDQWSPLNQSGKKQYDTNFLLQFQYLKTSMEKPKDLPRIDIVLDNARPAGGPPPMHQMDMGFNKGQGSDFTPNYMRHQQGGHNIQGRQNSRNRGRHNNMGPGPKPEPRIIIKKTVSVELKRATHAWKPVKELERGLGAEEKETGEVLRSVRSILNKLTPSKFNPLMRKVLELNINTIQRLNGVIDLIFEKAIDEPGFSEAYAMMCRGMHSIKVNDPEGKPVEFRKLLLTKCQKEFERDKTDQIHLSEMKEKYEAEKNKDLKVQLKAEYELEELKDRRRTLGNIRFIGELYKLKMLTENIMHNCIMQLFKAHGDDHLESLCRLLTTIGKDLDHTKGKMRMDQYFDQMRKITVERKTNSSRVRFMLQDVMDLRKSNWVQRAVKQTGPKTISEIHKDAKEEKEQLQLQMAAVHMQQNIPSNRTPHNRSGGRLGSRGSQPQQQPDDGWTNVGGKPKPIAFDPRKMKMTKSSFDEKTVTLGPQQGLGGWRGGSGSSSLSKSGSGGYSMTDREAERKSGVRSSTPTNMMNRFSALSPHQQAVEYEHGGRRQQPGRQSSREESRSGSRGSMGPPSGGRAPRKDERQQALETTKKLTSRGSSVGARSSRESSPAQRPRSVTPSKTVDAAKYTDYTAETMQKKSKAIINEFLSILDYKEAYECIVELNASPDIMSVFVTTALEMTLEKNKASRMNCGKILTHLLTIGQIQPIAFLKGVAALLEQAIDLEIDVPKVWDYYAEQLAPIFVEDASSVKVEFQTLYELAKPLISEGKGGIFVVKILKAMESYISKDSALMKFEASGLNWEDLLETNDARTLKFFYEDYDIKPTIAKQVTPQLLRVKYEDDILDLIRNGSECDQMFDWVEKNVEAKERSSNWFLRAMTAAVCKHAITGTGTNLTINKEKFVKYTMFMKKYLEGIEEREVQALYAAQRLNYELEQPPNLLKKLFEVLYDEEIIQESAFLSWKNTKDPQEMDGHSLAVVALNPFYTWLQTADAESD